MRNDEREKQKSEFFYGNGTKIWESWNEMMSWVICSLAFFAGIFL